MMRNRERGSAMLVTMIMITALLAGVAVLVSMQITTNRSAETTRSSMSALYCAEAGLVAARAIVKQNYASWAAALAASASGDTSEPAWLAAGLGTHDLNGDLSPDFEVYLKDNDDEVAPTPNDPAVDNDLRVFVVSRCTAYPDTPKQVMELIQWRGGGGCPHNAAGGCDGNGNAN